MPPPLRLPSPLRLPLPTALTSPELAAGLLAVLLLAVDTGVVSRSRLGLAVVACEVLVCCAVAAVFRSLRHGRHGTACVLTAGACALSLLVTSMVQESVLQRTPGWAELAGLLLLMCVTCRYGRRLPLVLSAAALLAATTRLGQRAPGLSDVPLLSPLDGFLTLLAAAFALLGVYLRAEDRRRRSTAEQVRQAERLELARDLHDHVAHHVTAIIVQAQAGEHIAERDAATALRLFSDIERTGQDGLVAMSRMVRLLRDPGTREQAAPPTPALTRVGDLVRRADTPEQRTWLTVSEDVDSTTWSPQLAKSVERLVQEGLTNVRKHARGATSVHVLLGSEGDRVVVRVRDNATGGHRARPRFRPSGFGLIGLTERLTELGGELDSGPMPEGGWELGASIPLK
ncbi:sensor histidine kinase [Streptomyces sp. NPDC059382]|uniref:sensor histidine kinase n=1 Tax=Streptomyces sp. NPDC059382 TaxID=3346816 RepID=UPI0036CB8C5D